MPVLRDIAIHLDPEETALTINRGRPNPQISQKLAPVLGGAQDLWQPAIVYELLPVAAVEPPEVRLELGGEPRALLAGPLAGLMDQAEVAMVFALTIGPALGEKVKEMQARGDHLGAYFLDSIGVLAQGEVGKHARVLAQQEAESRGWGVSYQLAPGSLKGWNVKQQRDLCSLLPLAEIGLRLTESSLLEPFKSSAGMIGLGPGFPHKTVRSACKWCDLRETCWRRRRDEDD